MTDDQMNAFVERFVLSFEKIGTALEGLDETYRRHLDKLYPARAERREAVVTRVQTEEDRIREAQGSSAKPLDQWLSEVEEEAAPKLEAWSPIQTPVQAPVTTPEPELAPVMASAPAPAAVAPTPASQQWQPEPEIAPVPVSRFAHEPEIPSAPARPRFAELAEPASSASNPAQTYAPLPRDYASEIPNIIPERSQSTAASIYGLASTPDHQDLDVPAFLRRGQF